MKRSVFYISDRTGITAEMLGHGLLTQFQGVHFNAKILPFIDTIEKAQQAVNQINQAAENDKARPLVFSTLIEKPLRDIIAQCNGLMLDFFATFISPLEQELKITAQPVIGHAHGMGVYANYKARIDAVNFALTNDDGVTTRNFSLADIILIGVSRSGKTPTCLYLALHYGILAANYPLTEEDMSSTQLPSILLPYRERLFGLTIDPLRLQQIRHERRSDSRYSSPQQCEFEVRTVERIYNIEKIPYLDTSQVSIEEIATTILQKTGLERRLHG